MDSEIFDEWIRAEENIKILKTRLLYIYKSINNTPPKIFQNKFKSVNRKYQTHTTKSSNSKDLYLINKVLNFLSRS